MQIREITNEIFDMLYNHSALTFEGLVTDEENMNEVYEFFEENFNLKERKCYVITGKQMNEQYRLNGNNAYQDDLSIVCFDLENFPKADIQKLAIKRFEFGGRWFDDVVDNNALREKEKK
jgi:hypothetical protein